MKFGKLRVSAADIRIPGAFGESATLTGPFGVVDEVLVSHHQFPRYQAAAWWAVESTGLNFDRCP
jgi:hypothetical protein